MSSPDSNPTTTTPSPSEIDWAAVPVIDRLAKLRAAIHEFIQTHPGAEEVAYVQGFMVTSLTSFVSDATEKFIAGQLEHGGDFTTIDHAHESKQERIDTFWYAEGTHWKTRQ